MLKDGKILVGKNKDIESSILLNKANRHGLITGATGTGKTITLKVLAESFSSAGVPVFMVDVKGDLAGTAFVGEENENLKERLDKLNIDNFEYKKFPVVYLDVYGKNGHPVRTTVESIGHRIMSKMLDLSEVQDSVLSMIYKIAKDEDKKLIDLKDLESMIVLIENKRGDYSLKYGNISTQTLATIKRNLYDFMADGGDDFFGEPHYRIEDLRGLDVDTGFGRINILDAQNLFNTPSVYVSMILWLLNSLNNELPEVGDTDKPKLVFFFDEAHLIFEEMPKSIIDYVIQTVKLIRSKGVGVYFISQSPSDLPDEVLSQLGNRIQHALRTYTPQEQKAVKAAADSYRANPKFDTKEAILALGTGEALVSFLDEKGEPSVVEKVTILPPQSRMGTISDDERINIMNNSPISGKYENKEETSSAYEANKIVLDELESNKAAEAQAKIDEKERKAQEKLEKEEAKRLKEEERERIKAEKEAEKAKKNSIGYKLGKKVANKATNKLLDKSLNKIFKGLFK